MSAPANQNFTLIGPYQSCAAGATGSQSFTYSTPNTALYSLDWKCQVPTVVGGGGASGLVVKISTNGSAGTVFQGAAGVCSGGKVYFLCTAADVITFNLSSTAAADLASLNSVQCTGAISQEV
jgi:hypothetical protein